MAVGEPIFVPWNKLNGLKVKKSVWNKEVFDQVETKIKQELDSIGETDRKEEIQAISNEEAIKK